jgi:hypothetical protein
VKLSTRFHVVSTLRMCGLIPPFPLHAFMERTVTPYVVPVQAGSTDTACILRTDTACILCTDILHVSSAQTLHVSSAQTLCMSPLHRHCMYPLHRHCMYPLHRHSTCILCTDTACILCTDILHATEWTVGLPHCMYPLYEEYKLEEPRAPILAFYLQN